MAALLRLPASVLAAVWLCTSVLATPARAACEAAAANDLSRPKIGLALSGGGARGAAHVGVIKVLEDMRVPIDFIAGTSVGAIIGGLYASGMNVKQLEETVTGFDWEANFRDQVSRTDRSFRRKQDDILFSIKPRVGVTDEGIGLPTGIVAGQQVDLLLRSLTLPVASERCFDKLAIPFRAVATDIVTGQQAVLGEGDLALAIRASLSIPAIITPVEIDGNLLVDGGVSNNLPIDVVRAMGADIVIAVDISTPLLTRAELTSVVTITEQLSNFLTRRNTDQQIASLTDSDILIVPDLGEVTSASFSEAPLATYLGAEAAVAHFDELKALALSRADFRQHLAGRRVFSDAPPTINFVRIENDSGVGDEVLASNLDVPLGQPLNVKQLEAQIGQLYGWDLFENIRYDIAEEDGQTGLDLDARRRRWGTDYLRFQLNLSDDFNGANFFNLGAAFTTPRIHRLGGEVRVGVQVGQEPGLALDIYQLLDVNSRYFTNPQISHQQRSVSSFEGENVVSEFRLTESGAVLDAGRNFGNWGELRFGLRRFAGEAEVRIGDPSTPDRNFNIGEALLRLSSDGLDNVNFPRRGSRFIGEWRVSRTLFGADDEFDQLRLTALKAKTWNKHTVLLQGRLGMTTAGTAPLQSLFSLGGFGDFSGFGVNELTGQHFGHLAAVYFRRIGNFALLPIYAGGSLEMGNVWQEKGDIGFDSLINAGSVFIGVDTVAGPVSLAYGRAESGIDAAYLSLGRVLGGRLAAPSRR